MYYNEASYLVLEHTLPSYIVKITSENNLTRIIKKNLLTLIAAVKEKENIT